MYTSELLYEGDLRTSATHSFSGTAIFTDAPLDNNGKAQAFSPTDLVATALAACMMTIMGIEARRMDADLKGTAMTVVKTMAADPRRISKVEVVFNFLNEGLTSGQKQKLEHAAHNCPVAKSIHPEIIQEITFNYPA